MNYNNRSAGSCSCSVREAMTPFPEDYSVAMAYVPIQTDISAYDEMKASGLAKQVYLTSIYNNARK